MSTVDKRVVQMVFDNEEFEKNIAKSQKSLESIDKQIGTLGDDLKTENLSKAVTKGMNEAEQIVSAKAEVFRGIMIKIGGYIGDFFVETIGKAQKAINNLTFDQINVGFDKYEKKLANVQTLMNASGESIEGVEERLKELNWYTDETSANFTDMANNIGKFISAGVGLDDATEAMMGISNWAYLSGANLQQASMAMYNFSQAMGTGVMMTQDWKSIENANMATKEFKQTVIETARELYKEGKIQEDVVEAYGVTAENFRSTLKDKWFTTDIMKAATQAYGSYSTYVKEVQEKEIADIDESVRKRYAELNNGKVIKFDTASQTMDYLNFVEKNYKKEIKEIIATNGESSEELSKFVEKLGISTEMAIAMTKDTVTQDGKVVEGYFYEISKKAFLAAQEYKTFADVISATTDAVSTKWMNIFQEIFGNFEEAKALWSEMGDMFYDIFAQPVQDLLDIAEIWNRYSGRQMLFGIAEEGEEIYSIFQLLETTIRDISSAISDAFYVVFPQLRMVDEAGNSLETLGRQLAVATYCIREFIKESAPTEEQLTKINEIAVSMFKILRGIVKVIYSIIRSIKVIVRAITPSLDVVLEALGIVNIYADGIEGTLEALAQTIWRVANVIAAIIKGFRQAAEEGRLKQYIADLCKFLLVYAVKTISEFVTAVSNAFNGVESEFGTFGEKIGLIVGTIGKYIYQITSSIINGLGSAINDFMASNVTTAFVKFLKSIPSSLGGIFTHLFDIFRNLLGIIENILGAISGFLEQLNMSSTQKAGATLASIVGLVLVIIEAFLEGIKEGRARAMTRAITELIEGIGGAFRSFQNMVNAVALNQIALSILMIAVSASLLAKIPSRELMQTMIILTGSLVALVGALAIVSSFSASKVGSGGLAGILNSLQKVAIAVLIFSNVVVKLMGTDAEQVKQGLANLSAMFFFIGAFIFALRIITNPWGGYSLSEYEFQMKTIIGIIKNITWVSIAMAVLSSSFIALAKLNSKETAAGILSIIVIFAILYKLIHEIKSISNRTNPAGLATVNKTMLGVSAAILMFTLAIGVLVTTLSVLTVAMGLLPEENLYRGLDGMFVILGFIVAFTGIMKLILTGPISLRYTNAGTYIMSGFARALLLVSIALLVLAVSVGLFINAVATLGVLSKAGILSKGMHTLIVFFALLAAYTLVMSGIMFINVGFRATATAFGIFLLSCSIAFTALAIGINIFATSVAKLGKIPQATFATGMVRLGNILVAMGLILGIAKLLGMVGSVFSKKSATGIMPGRKSTATDLTSLGKEIFLLGAGLSLIAASLAILMIPIGIMAAFDKDAFWRGYRRCFMMILLVTGFIGALMLLFGVTNGVAASMGYGAGIANRTTTDETNTMQTLFKGKKHKLTKEMNGFGEEMYKMAKALLLVAASLTLLLIPIAVLGTMGTEKPSVYWKGILGVSILMGMIAGIFVAMFPVMKYANSTGKLWAIVAALAMIGLVIVALVETTKKLAEWMDESAKIPGQNTNGWAKFAIGLLGILGILVLVSGDLFALSKIKKGDLMTAAAAFAIVAASLIGIAFSMKLIGDTFAGKELLLIGTAGFLLAFIVVITAAIKFLNKADSLIAAASFAIIAASMIAIAGAVMLFGDAWNKYGNSLLIGAGIILAFTIVIGILTKVLAGVNSILGAVSIAIVVLAIAAAVFILCYSLTMLNDALIRLVDFAEKSKSGWDMIEQGVLILQEVAITLAIVMGIMTLIGALFLPGTAAALIFATAVLFLALAFYLVIEGIIDLSNDWEKIKSCLDDLTQWLKDHKEEWVEVIDTFVDLIKTSMIDGIKECLAETSVLMNGAISILSKGWWQYWKDVGEERRQAHDENKRLEQLEEETYNELSNTYLRAIREGKQERIRNGEQGVVVGKDMASGMNAAENRRILIEEYGEALKDFLLAHSNWKFARADELRELIYGSFAGAKPNNITDEEIKEMYIAAGGTYLNELGEQENLETRAAESKKRMYDYMTKSGEAYAKEREEITANNRALEEQSALLNGVLPEGWDKMEDVGLAGGMAGDGLIIGETNDQIQTTTKSTEELNKQLDELLAKSKADPTYGKAQLNTEEALKNGQKSGILFGTGFSDGFWTAISNADDGLANFLYSLFGKEKVDAFSNQIGEWGKSLGNDLSKGFESLTGVSKDDLTDMAFSLFGVDANSEEGKKLRKTVEENGVGGLISSVTKDVQTKMENGQDLMTALNSTLDEKGLSFLNIDSNGIVKDISDALNLDVLDQGDWSEVIDKIKIEDIGDKLEEELKEEMKDLGLDVDAEDGGVNFAQNYTSGLTTGLDSYDPNEILKQWGFNGDDAFNIGEQYGIDQATGQIDGYKEAIDKQSKDLFKGTDLGSKYAGLTGGSSKSSNTVTRVINGQYIEAAKTLDLVKPIFQEGVFNKKTMASIVDKGKKWGEKLSLFSSVTPKTRDFWDKVDEEGKLFAMANPDTANFWDDVYIEGNKIMTDKFKTNPLAIAAFMTSKMSEKKVEKSIEDGVKTTTTAVKKEQGSKFVSKNSSAATSSTSAVTTIDKEQAKNKAAQNGYYVDPNGNVYGSKAQAQTGTSAQSATQSAASAIDYLAAIHAKTDAIYTQLQYVSTQLDSGNGYAMAIMGDVSEIKTKPIPAVVDSNQAVRELIGPLNKALGITAGLTRRGVTS